MPGIPVTGVSELVLEVQDLEAAEAFYAGVLGLPVVEHWQQREAVWLLAGTRTGSASGENRRSQSPAGAAGRTSTSRSTSRPMTTTPPSNGSARTASIRTRRWQERGSAQTGCADAVELS